MNKIVKFAILAVVVLIVLAVLGTGILSNPKVRVRWHRLWGRVEQTVPGVSQITGDTTQMAVKCRGNLNQILSAKRKYAADNNLNFGDRVSWDQLKKEFNWRTIPTCPAGGTYSINTIGKLPTCSIGANQTVDQVDDHIINE